MTGSSRLHVVAVAGEDVDPSPRFRCLLAGCEASGVDCRVGAYWVGACAVSFLMDGAQRQDVFSSIDDALLAAGLLSSPVVEASDIRILASDCAEGG